MNVEASPVITESRKLLNVIISPTGGKRRCLGIGGVGGTHKKLCEPLCLLVHVSVRKEGQQELTHYFIEGRRSQCVAHLCLLNFLATRSNRDCTTGGTVMLMARHDGFFRL